MNTRLRASSTLLRRLRRLPALVLPLIVGAMLFTGVAHAAHLHKLDAIGTNHALHCGLCVQFERLAAAPSSPQLVPPSPLIARAALPDGVAPVLDLLDCLYQARGPPRA